MFKTLIATALLSASVSSNALQYEVPHYNSQLRTLYGAYVFRDDVDVTSVAFRTGNYTFNFEGYTNKPYCYVEDNETGNYRMGWCDDFSVTSSVNTQSIGRIINMSFGEGRREQVYHFQWKYGESTLSGKSSAYHGLQIYFNYEFSCSQGEYDVFNALFTNAGNQYNHIYNGYYTFVNTNTISSTSGVCVLGSNMYNNNLYFMMTLENGVVNVVGYSGEIDNPFRDVNVYDTGGFHGDNFIIFSNVLIYDDLKYTMEDFGVFAYVYRGSNADFTDMATAIADTPIKVLRGLFGFELFGISLFAAFTSVVTLVLIAIVLKKII